MSNKDELLDLIKNSQLSESELKIDIFYKYLPKKYDIMRAKPMTEEALKGKLEEFTEEDVIELIKMLGGIPQENQDNIIQDEEKAIVNKNKLEEIKDLDDSHNTLLIENTKLKDEMIKKDETIKELIDNGRKMRQRLSQLERMMNSLKITETGELIEIDNEKVDELYLRHKTEGITQLDNAYIVEKDDMTFITKAYYPINKRKEVG